MEITHLELIERQLITKKEAITFSFYTYPLESFEDHKSSHHHLEYMYICMCIYLEWTVVSNMKAN